MEMRASSDRADRRSHLDLSPTDHDGAWQDNTSAEFAVLPPPPPSAEMAWWQLWHEPWRHAHPRWLESRLDQAPWLTRFLDGGPSLRFGYRRFCELFDIEGPFNLPPTWVRGLPPDLQQMPLSPTGLMRAAVAIGRVGYVSHCMTTSREQLARLFNPDASADATPWRDALRQARARPLLTQAGGPEDSSDRGLQRWAFPLMAQLIDERVPGAWSRLRLRIAPQLMVHVATRGVVLPESATALRRQAWRLWHGSHPS